MGRAGCARAPSPHRPRHLLRSQKSPGKVGGGGRCCGLRCADLSVNLPSRPAFFFKQMSPIDELKVRSSPAPPTQAAHCGGGRGEGGRGRGSGAGNQAQRTLKPAGSLPSPRKAAAWGSQRGVPAREQGAWPAGPLPGSRPAPTIGRIGGGGESNHQPSGVWVTSSWLGLGLKLAPGDSPGGQILTPPGCLGPCLNPLGPEFHFLPHRRREAPLIGTLAGAQWLPTLDKELPQLT